MEPSTHIRITVDANSTLSELLQAVESFAKPYGEGPDDWGMGHGEELLCRPVTIEFQIGRKVT
jgi:hypothetical protein